jgi:DNA-binding CsgD family transcriptional regulator
MRALSAPVAASRAALNRALVRGEVSAATAQDSALALYRQSSMAARDAVIGDDAARSVVTARDRYGPLMPDTGLPWDDNLGIPPDRVPLSPYHHEVLKLAASGLTVAQMVPLLHISYAGVRARLAMARERVGGTTIAESVQAWRELYPRAELDLMYLDDTDDSDDDTGDMPDAGEGVA